MDLNTIVSLKKLWFIYLFIIFYNEEPSNPPSPSRFLDDHR